MRWLAAPLMLLLGCHELDEFASGDDVFRGQLTGADSEVFQRGFQPETVLELTFDPEVAEGRGGERASPGSIETYVCSPSVAKCEQRSPGPIVDGVLRPFPTLAHDVLGDYDFPGPGRVRNYIMSTRRAAAGGQSVIVFVSLMEAGGIEVRLMVPGGGEAGEKDGGGGLFGVFPLHRDEP